MGSASVRVPIVSVCAALACTAVRYVAVPEDRARLLAHIGISVERPKRYLIRCAETDTNCVDWYHDNLIPTLWDDVLLYGGMSAILLYAGYVAAKGSITRPIRGAVAGAVAGVVYCLIGLLTLFLTAPSALSRISASILLEVSIVIAYATLVAYVGGYIARRVA